MKYLRVTGLIGVCFWSLTAAAPAFSDTIYDFTIGGNFSSTVGTPVTGSGTFTVSSTPSTVFGFTAYQVESATFDGSAVTLSNYEGADNYLFLSGYGYGTPQGLTDGEGIAFETTGGQSINITYAGNGLYNEYALIAPNDFSEGVRGDFSVGLATTPLPSTWALMTAVLGLGFMALRWKQHG